MAGGSKSFAAFSTSTPGLATNKDYFYFDSSFTIALPVATQAIGLFFNVASVNTPNANDLYINTAEGNATNGGSNYDTTTQNYFGSNTLFFVGLISATPLTSATIGMALAGNSSWNIDNLTTATPEPTSIGLLSFGLAGLLGYSRKRAQWQAACLQCWFRRPADNELPANVK